MKLHCILDKFNPFLKTERVYGTFMQCCESGSHQMKGSIRNQIRNEVINWIFYLEARIRIWINIKVKCRIRIRIKVSSRIRIRIRNSHRSEKRNPGPDPYQ